MDTLSTSANIATFLCLPATIAALPGVIFMISARMRKWFENHHRALSPIYVVIIIIAASVVVITRMGWLDRAPPPLIPVNNVTFDNEVVLLDGKSYYRCIFKDVKFMWNGGDFALTESKYAGSRIIETNNTLISTTISFLAALHVLTPEGTKIDIPKDIINEDTRRGSKP